MSCCKKPEKVSQWTSIPEFNKPTFLRPGENVECYAARAGNPTGDQSGGGEPTDLITTPSIVPDCTMSINLQFKVSGPRVPTLWEMLGTVNGNLEQTTISGLSFNPTTGVLSGQFDPQAEGRTFRIFIRASDASGQIDIREFTIIPKKCRTGDDLKFIHPLPGSRTSSPFGPRASPCTNCSSMHKGVDFGCGGTERTAVAACDGTVKFTGEMSGYGKIVIVEHKNAAGYHMADTAYAHLGRFLVTTGQRIAAGTPIGILGPGNWSGRGTGPHLHFELRKNGMNHIDPLPYINGTFEIGKGGLDQYGEPDNGNPTFESVKTNNNSALTTAKAMVQQCQQIDPPLIATPNDSADIPEVQLVSPNPARNATCSGPVPPLATVKAQIDTVLDLYPELDVSDRKFIHVTAQIESGYNPFAKNPNSSALGLYQFLDSTGKQFYKGGAFAPTILSTVEFTCENRCDVVYATHAMVAWYKKEILPGYSSYIASGQTRILGRQIASNSVTAKYPALTKLEWCYAFHHAGFPAMCSGKDTQGIEYIQKRKTVFV